MIPYLDKFLALFRPNQTKTTGAIGFNELAFAANLMTVDKLHAILREAEIGSVDRLFALYRDIISGHTHLQTEFNTRKLAVLGDPISFAPPRQDQARRRPRRQSLRTPQRVPHLDPRPQPPPQRQSLSPLNRRKNLETRRTQ